MKRRMRPLLASGVPWASQNSMRLPVPVCTLAMISLITTRARGSGTSSQPGNHSPVRLSSWLQRLLCQMIFQSSSFWSYAKDYMGAYVCLSM